MSFILPHILISSKCPCPLSLASHYNLFSNRWVTRSYPIGPLSPYNNLYPRMKYIIWLTCTRVKGKRLWRLRNRYSRKISPYSIWRCIRSRLEGSGIIRFICLRKHLIRYGFIVMLIVCRDVLKEQIVSNIEGNQKKWKPPSSPNDTGQGFQVITSI